MKEIIPLFFSAIKDWPWKKIVATAISVAIIAYALSHVSCGVWRKTTTYGVSKSVYTKYDTIRTRGHVKIPKNYTYEE